MIKQYLIGLSLFYSVLAWADAGCQSLKTPACFLWFSILLLGISLFFWVIFLPIFIALNLIFKLEKKYKIYCLILSFTSVFGTIGLSCAGLYNDIWGTGELEKYRIFITWIITPVMFLLIYLGLYLHQKKRNLPEKSKFGVLAK